MRIKISILCMIFIYIGFAFPAFAQLNTDSLLKIIENSSERDELSKAYLDYGYQLYRSDADTAIFYAKKALLIAEELGSNKIIFSAYNLLGLANQTKGLYNLSLDYFEQELTYLPNNDLNRAKTLHNMALAYQFVNDKNSALKSELEAIKISENNNDSVLIAVIAQTMCNIYRDMGDFKQAEIYILKSIKILEQIKDTGIDNKLSMIGNGYNSYGNLLLAMGRPLDAIDKQKTSIAIHDKSGDLFNQAIAYENLGNAHLKMNQFELALQNFNTAKDIMQQLNSLTDVGYELLNLADVYVATGKYDAALINLDSAITIFKLSSAFNYTVDAYNKKYKVYELMNDPEQALLFYKKYINLSDSLNSEEKKIELLRLKEEFESTQKEQQIENLKIENQLREKEKQLQITIRNIAILLIIIVIIIAFLLFNRSRIKEQVRQLAIRNEIASDLHDDIGSTLSSISMYSDIIKNQIEDNNSSTKPLLEKMSRSSKDMIDSMSDIVWAIKPSNDSFKDLITRMHDYALEQCTLTGIHLTMEQNLLLTNLKLPMEKRRDVYLIFKEAVFNAVKYSECSELSVSFSIVNKSLIMEISDNGKGIIQDVTTNSQPVFGGNGINNMKMRANKLKGRLSIATSAESGTSIALDLPLNTK